MTTWLDIQQALPVWIAKLAKQPVGCVYWNDNGRPLADPAIAINVTTYQDVISHESITIEEDGRKLRSIHVHRTLTLQVRTETTLEIGKVSALQTSDLIRLRSMREDYSDALGSMCGCYTVKMPSDLVNVSYESAQAVIHARSFDLFLAAHFLDTDIDESLGEFSIIERSGAVYPGSIEITSKDLTV